MIDISERWLEIEPLIDRLFDVPAAERAEWLRANCGDAGLRALVAQALDDAPGVESLERGMAQWLPALADGLDDLLPVLPGYRVLRFVGAGGMASVFEAQRELPGGPQTVALKLLRLDVHDADERRGFLREQRILARLQHPHIAQLLDAGFSPTGTPFLALEFVAGDNLVAHCERHALPARERLALFMDVCTAVEHAHRNLIVHRDLKPSNVLVGADGGVKLVDFGIAKLLTGEAEATRTQARRMTRAYAAPEQFAGDAATTAIDVYALGVLLAELLGGQRPRRAGDAVDARAPAFDGDALRRRLGADLHAIVQEATRPDPLRRYPGVAMLREDIQRHLEGRPLLARADRIAVPCAPGSSCGGMRCPSRRASRPRACWRPARRSACTRRASRAPRPRRRARRRSRPRTKHGAPRRSSPSSKACSTTRRAARPPTTPRSSCWRKAGSASTATSRGSRRCTSRSSR
jgi:serine/threonine-protein kinase